MSCMHQHRLAYRTLRVAGILHGFLTSITASNTARNQLLGSPSLLRLETYHWFGLQQTYGFLRSNVGPAEACRWF